MATRELKAFSILLAAGFLAGFGLSGGATRFATGSDERPASGGAEQQGAGGGGGGKHGASKERAGADGTANESAGSQKAGSSAESRAKPDGGAASETAMSEADLRLLLAGNTLRSERGEIADRYLSRRGWQGQGDRAAFVIHRWTLGEDQVCVGNPGTAPSCEAVSIAREAKAGDGVGAVLGTMTTRSGLRYSILRGNVAALPERVPLIDATDPEATVARVGAPAGSGAAVLKALIGQAATARAAGKDGRSGFVFDPGGDWIVARPLAPEAGGGLQVSVGRWAVREGALCLDQPGLELARTCYQAQQWSPRAFRLVPTRSGTALDLALIVDGA